MKDDIWIVIKGTKRWFMITHNGMTQTVNAWAMQLKLNYETVLSRLRNGMTVAEAFDPKPLPYHRPKLTYCRPVELPADMSPEEAALRGLVTADQYLDLYHEPRRPWTQGN